VCKLLLVQSAVFHKTVMTDEGDDWRGFKTATDAAVSLVINQVERTVSWSEWSGY